MTVIELIEKLEKIKDKDRIIVYETVESWGTYEIISIEDDCSEDDGSAYDIVLTDRDLSLTKKRPLQK